MKVTKDNVVGGVVALVIVAILSWGCFVTNQLNKVISAHDALVTILSPVLNQIQMANEQLQKAKQASAPVQPAPVQAAKPSK